MKKVLLSTSLYVYTTPTLKKLAKQKSKKFRSYSHYVSWLIAKDVGQKREAKRLKTTEKKAVVSTRV
jgi:hypothetical protein